MSLTHEVLLDYLHGMLLILGGQSARSHYCSVKKKSRDELKIMEVSEFVIGFGVPGQDPTENDCVEASSHICSNIIFL